MSLLLKTIYILAAIYLGVLALMYFGQRKLLYRADPVRVAPRDIGLKDVAEREMLMPDFTAMPVASRYASRASSALWRKAGASSP
jgi:hypothetical protein